MTLAKPRFELAAAEACLALMHRAQTLAELEAAWSALLTRLERVWYKTLNQMKPIPRFLGWSGKYHALRGTDELLRYIVNARGADEHTIGEIVGIPFKESSLGRLHIVGEGGETAALWAFPVMKEFLERAGLSEEAVVHAEAHEKMTFRASQARLNIIHNRGVAHTPPTAHLGKPLQATDPIAVATLAISFYRDFIQDVESTFPG